MDRFSEGDGDFKEDVPKNPMSKFVKSGKCTSICRILEHHAATCITNDSKSFYTIAIPSSASHMQCRCMTTAIGFIKDQKLLHCVLHMRDLAIFHVL